MFRLPVAAQDEHTAGSKGGGCCFRDGISTSEDFVLASRRPIARDHLETEKQAERRKRAPTEMCHNRGGSLFIMLSCPFI